MERVTVCVFRSERKYGLTTSLLRWTLFHMMVNKKDQNWSSHILPLLTIVQMVSSSTVCMKSKWQGELIHFLRRGLFKDFPGPYFAKCLCWKLCFGYKHVHMQKRQTIRAWNHVQSRHSLCIGGSMDICERNKRTMGTKKQVFSHIL